MTLYTVSEFIAEIKRIIDVFVMNYKTEKIDFEVAGEDLHEKRISIKYLLKTRKRQL